MIGDNGIPAWLRELLESPQHALPLLFEGRLSSAPTAPETALESALDWLDWLDDASIVAEVDDAAAVWTRERWGAWTPTDARDVATAARAWSVVCDLAVNLPGAIALRKTLRGRFPDRLEYLGPLSTGPPQDPLGRFLAAGATGQEDRSLASTWWQLLELPEEVPLHHLRYGFAGVMQMPRYESERGRFPLEVARALTTAGRSLSRAARDGRLSVERAERLFTRLAGRGIARYPEHVWWERALDDVADEPMRSWMHSVFPGLAAGVTDRTVDTSRRRRARRPTPDIHAWAQRSARIRAALDAMRKGALVQADGFLSEQRRYAEETGDSHPFVQSLCNLSTGVRSWEPARAVAWALEARAWEASNGYTWSTLLQAIRQRDGLSHMLGIAFDGIQHVPDEPVLWNELAEVLGDLNCLVQAREVFTQYAELFPEDAATAHRGLGNVLLGLGLFSEAESVFRTALNEVPTDRWALPGLARALRELRRPEDAIAVVEGRLDSGEGVGYLWSQYVPALREAGRIRDSEVARDHAERRGFPSEDPRIFPHPDARLWHGEDVDSRTREAQARVLSRAASRRPSERQVLWSAAEEAFRGDDRDSIQAERTLIILDRGDAREAITHASQQLARFPASLPLLHSSALVQLEVARDGSEYSTNRLRELSSPYRALAERNAALRPLAELGVARVALALQDGAPAEKSASEAVARLAGWRRGPDPPGRHVWWQRRVQEILLDGSVESGQLTVDAVRRREANHQRLLRQIEQDLVLSFAIYA